MDRLSGKAKAADTLAWLSAICLALIAALWIYFHLTEYPLLASDDGQWIMFSRYYRGETTPDYIDPRSVHPALPFALAVITSVVDDSILAVVLVSAALYFCLVLTAFWAVLTLFHTNVMAILTAILFGFGQPFYMYMTVGLLPQLTALVGMNIALIALARIGQAPGSRANWMTLGSVCLLVPFSHLPTAPVFFLLVVTSLMFLVFQKRLSFSKVLVSAATFLLAPLLVWITYLTAYWDVINEYISNQAGFHRLGINTLTDFVQIDLSLILLAAFSLASLVLLGLLALHLLGEQQSSITILLIWLLVPLGFMMVVHLLKLGTDYGRFIYYFVASPLFALAFFLQITTQRMFQVPALSRLPRLGWLSNIGAGVGLFLTVLIVVNSIRFSMQLYPKLVSELALNYSSSLIDVANWLVEADNAQTVFAPSRPEATWIEGLTGQATLFPEEFSYIYRPGMMERSLVANLIDLGATHALENGLVYLRFQEYWGGTPYHPNIAVYHQGEYASLFSVQDSLITFHVNGSSQRLTLASDFERVGELQFVQNANRLTAVSKYVTSDSNEISVVKQVAISENSPNVSVTLSIVPDASTTIDSVEFAFSDLSEPTKEAVIKWTALSSIEHDGQSVRVMRQEPGGDLIETSISATPRPTILWETPANAMSDSPYLSFSFDVSEEQELLIELRLAPVTSARFRTGLHQHTLTDLIQTFNVGPIIINQTNHRSLSVFGQMGFEQVYSNWNYVIYRSRD